MTLRGTNMAHQTTGRLEGSPVPFADKWVESNLVERQVDDLDVCVGSVFWSIADKC